MDALQITGLVLGVAALAFLSGCAVGYFTASADLELERKKARIDGFTRGVSVAADRLNSKTRIATDEEQESI